MKKSEVNKITDILSIYDKPIVEDKESDDFMTLKGIARFFTFESTYQELKSHIHDDYFMKVVHYFERDIGKTTALIRLSGEYNIPIFTIDSSEKIYISKQAKNFSLEIEIIDSIPSLDKIHTKTILVDETTTIQDRWKDIEKHLLDNEYKIIGIKGE